MYQNHYCTSDTVPDIKQGSVGSGFLNMLTSTGILILVHLFRIKFRFPRHIKKSRIRTSVAAPCCGSGSATLIRILDHFLRNLVRYRHHWATSSPGEIFQKIIDSETVFWSRSRTELSWLGPKMTGGSSSSSVDPTLSLYRINYTVLQSLPLPLLYL